MNSFLVVWCVFICLTTTIAFGKNDTKLSSHTFKLGEKTYFVNMVTMNFNDAINFCKAHEMELVAIENSTENSKIFSELKEISSGGMQIWTSGTKLAKSNEWIWLTKMEVITYFDWGSGQPSNTDGNEFCLAVYPNFYDSGYWNDIKCDALLYALCQSL